MIAIVDYSAGNTQSVKNMLDYIGVDSVISSNPQILEKADKFILPGVGHFNPAMVHLKDNGIIDVLIKRVLVEKRPVLGICLGMQLLTNFSEESSSEGLGWIDGITKKFSFNPEDNLKVPHTGWNNVDFRKSDEVDINISNPSKFYFNHSYFVSCYQEKDIIATTNYGIRFPSAIKRGHIWGVQFHPEKSNQIGIQFFNNFLLQL